jgi:hypothetical protein
MKTLTVGSNEMLGSDVSQHSLLQKILLACGALSSLLYVGTTILGGLVWEGYSSVSQSVSELSALESPSRPIVLPLYTLYDFLVIAFALGLWGIAGRRRALRVVACLMVVFSVAGLCAGKFGSMHLRGSEATQSDVLHIILTIVTLICLFLMIGLAANTFGKSFRLYSIGTFLVMFVFGGLAGMDGPRVAANLPTPWLGVTERINIYSFMLWIMVLAIALLYAPSDSRAHKD